MNRGFNKTGGWLLAAVALVLTLLLLAKMSGVSQWARLRIDWETVKSSV